MAPFKSLEILSEKQDLGRVHLQMQVNVSPWGLGTNPVPCAHICPSRSWCPGSLILDTPGLSFDTELRAREV